MPGTSSLAVDGAALDGLTVDGGARPDPRPEGHGRHADGPARRRRRSSSRSPATSSRSRRSRRKALADGAVGYVRLTGFSDAAADEFVDALKAHIAAGRTKLILDLRGNPGGYVTAARNDRQPVHRLGPIFWEQDAAGRPGRRPTRLGDGVATDPTIQLICLIDGGSASASEIVAGALQDTSGPRSSARQSFGKGTVQQWQELTGEGGAFRLTIARWLTPDKRWIHGVGLTPDVVGDAARRRCRPARTRCSTRRSRCSAATGRTGAAGRGLTPRARRVALLRSPRASGTVSGNERR